MLKGCSKARLIGIMFLIDLATSLRFLSDITSVYLRHPLNLTLMSHRAHCDLSPNSLPCETSLPNGDYVAMWLINNINPLIDGIN